MSMFLRHNAWGGGKGGGKKWDGLISFFLLSTGKWWWNKSKLSTQKKLLYRKISLDHCLIHFRILLVFLFFLLTQLTPLTHDLNINISICMKFHSFLFKKCVCVCLPATFSTKVFCCVFGFFPCWIFYLDFGTIFALINSCIFFLYLCSITSNFKVRIHVKTFIVWHNK